MDSLEVRSCQSVVVGSGAAGLNAARQLFAQGVTDVAIVTQRMVWGTSRNTGSDKQTYYKLTLSGDTPDSVMDMARDLFSGGCVDGDLALVEAALSAPCFLSLCALGVPFPHDRFGGYAGYKTDHDPRMRATSAGPYTSRLMTEALEREVRSQGIVVWEHLQLVGILTHANEAVGIICIRLDSESPSFVAINCRNVILATGGPAGIYHNSVYPASQNGATGIALLAGAEGKNLTEWQYGLASIAPRWNVSGTYQQALPRYISTDANGDDAREFLGDSIPDRDDLLLSVFLKGYQWPFDVRRARAGSSRVDAAVYREIEQKGRHVFLDFTRNPGDGFIDIALLPDEARAYLNGAGCATLPIGHLPVDRLIAMNRPAYDFYLQHGVDLARQPLEIALCAQHNNGGLSGDAWWQTTIKGLFAVGECNGSHGVTRPGGSALNSGQAGSTRAAQYISHNANAPARGEADFLQLIMSQIQTYQTLVMRVICTDGQSNVRALLMQCAQRMSALGGPVRDRAGLTTALAQTRELLDGFSDHVRCTPEDMHLAFRLHDRLVTQWVYLSAMLDYLDHGGASRGSALYGDMGSFTLDNGHLDGSIQTLRLIDGRMSFSWRDARPIPAPEAVFENVWREYRERSVWR